MATAIIPYLIVEGAAEAIELYQELFDAKLLSVFKPSEDGRILNAMLAIEGAMFMLMDAFPEHNPHLQAPTVLGGASQTVHLQFDSTERVDEIFSRIGRDFSHIQIPELQFWGDYYGQFTDPFGQSWSLGSTPPRWN